MMAASIREIAEKCGQPLYIVGRVLNENSGIDDDVRGQVLEAARSLGYPVSGGRGRTFNVGVLFEDDNYSGLTHPFFASMLNAFKETVEAHGCDVTFINHNIGTDSASLLEHCLYRNVDGVCLALVNFYSDEVKELLNSGIPCVTVDYPTQNAPCVMSENKGAMHLLVDYAVSMGHRRIAFISGQRNSEVTEQRISQFFECMKDHGLDVPKGYFVEGRYGDVGCVRNMVTELLARPDRPSCILLPDDSCYFGAQEAIRALELRIPADVSVAGFDGITLTQSLRPQLTTIKQDSEEMGRQAALKLIKRFENPDESDLEPVKIPVKLIKGATIGWCEEW